MRNDYEMVIGLEVHVELSTRTKIFCGCPVTFGEPPNTQCCPVCMGMPGALPVLNRRAAEYAVMAGLATHCKIARRSELARKQYFYPDLPKAYQISQFDTPLCEDGYLDILTDGSTARIGITRIHIEEDAGKLFHTAEHGTMLDCNRCGVPLIEIVSAPDIRSPAQAVAYARSLRTVMRYLGISDCRMQQGSLRCDVNLSVRKRGETRLGTRTEIKNLNSFSFMQKAIESEFRRQTEILMSGGAVTQETRRFDETTGRTHAMRGKEDAMDYRYFPDPDLPPVLFTEAQIDTLRRALPVLPDERIARLTAQYGIPRTDAERICAERICADYFDRALSLTAYPKILAGLFLGEILPTVGDPPSGELSAIEAADLAAVADMAGEEVIHMGTAKKLIGMIKQTHADPRTLVRQYDLAQIRDPDTLMRCIRRAMEENPKSVADYRKGKKAAAQAVIGRVMAQTAGRADPVLTRTMVLQQLDSGEET